MWYGLLLKSHWKKLKKKDSPASVLDFILIFSAMCAVAFFMNNGCLETHINGGTVGHGLFHGGLYGLSYAVLIICIHHLYQKKSVIHFLIDSGYSWIFFSAIGGMLALLKLMVYDF